jgi:hypothetical protein
VELCQSDLEDEDHGQELIAKARIKVLKEFTKLANALNQVGASHSFATFDSLLELLSSFGSVWTMELKVAEHYFNAALEVGVYSSRLPGFHRNNSPGTRLSEVVGEFNQVENNLGFNVLSAGAIRGISSFSPNRAQFEYASQFLATAQNSEISKLSIEDKLALVAAYRFATIGERENGDSLDAARLQLKLCVNLLKSSETVENQISNAVLRMIVTACHDIGSIDNLMYSAADLSRVQKLLQISEDSYSIVERCTTAELNSAFTRIAMIILCQSFNEIEIACRKIQSQCSQLKRSEFFRNAPGSTNYFPCHSHDSYSELNSSGSSWN